MRFSTSGNLDDRLCDVEDRMEMLGAAVDHMADYDSTGAPTVGVMRGLAATLEELKGEINSIANAYLNEKNEVWARENPELAKMAQEAADRGRGARPSRRAAKARTASAESGRAR